MLGRLAARIEATVVRGRAMQELAPQAGALAEWLPRLARTVEALGTIAAREGLEAALANASLFLDAFGHVVVAWLWLDQALCAAVPHGQATPAQRAGVRLAARYFIDCELPLKRHALALVAQGDRSALDAPLEAF